MSRRRHLAACLCTLLAAGCGQKTTRPVSPSPTASAASPATGVAEPPEAWSLFGEALVRPEPSAERRAELDANLRAALDEFDANPTSEEAIIWVGRRLAYLGRYREAIATFTRGLADHPESHKLLRHRGHRFITIRRNTAAVTDLRRAAQHVELEDIADEVEPDGLPNALNLPRSTSHTNIYYHLGLAHYLLGDFGAAQRAYEKCMSYSLNDDMIVATSYWLYLTNQRLGRNAEAIAVLASIDSQMDVIENHTYLRLLLLFKEQLTVDELRGGAAGDGIDDATLGYGIGAWHLIHGDSDRAELVFRDVVRTDAWAAFGYIAAEAELWRGVQEAMEP